MKIRIYTHACTIYAIYKALGKKLTDNTIQASHLIIQNF